MATQQAQKPAGSGDGKSGEFELEFEAMFEAAGGARVRPRRPGPGDEVQGVIVRVGDRSAEVSLEGDGGPFDALFDLGGAAELPKPGDRFRGYVLRVRDRTLEVATGVARGAVDLGVLYDALAGGLPIEGKVVEVNKGGLVVECGPVQGFCPLGQMDIRRIEDPSVFVGQKLMFQVTEMREGRSPVLSRRRVLEAEAAQKAEETRKKLVPGARLRGVVTSVRDYGAFVDLGGLEGLLPRSELGYGRKHPSEVLQMGQVLEVEVLRHEPSVDGGRDRTTLSLRAMATDPFEAAAQELPERAICRGRVLRIQPYGAFIELCDGVEGLVHVSAFGKRIGTPRDVFKEGDATLVRVRSIDQVARRIALAYVDGAQLDVVRDPALVVGGNSLGIDVVGVAFDQGDTDEAGEAGAVRAHAPAKSSLPAVGSLVQGAVDRHLRFGLLVGLTGGHEGFVPYNELGVASINEARRKYPTGAAIELLAFEVREDGRIRLSATRAAEQKERDSAREWLSAQQPPKPASAIDIGSFGELLKQKLGL